ncbi:MAG: hypothetical protein U0470_05525 [Anaerolineae bacterium]
MVERHRSPWHGHRLGLLAREILATRRAWHRGEIDLRDADRARRHCCEHASSNCSTDRPHRPGRKACGASPATSSAGLDELWRFLDDPLVHPTNNLAAAAAALRRDLPQLSFGTDSEAGSRYLERLLSTAAT